MVEARVSVDAGRGGADVVSTPQPAVRPTSKTSTEAERLWSEPIIFQLSQTARAC
jgi:hypothetical protein